MATVVWRYTGNRTRFIGGVPARDLSEADWDRLSPELKRRVRQSDLYGQVQKEQIAEAKRADATEQPSVETPSGTEGGEG